ncbi:MAG: ABC transporter ATP-binding protein [Nitrososphaerota archaeon]|nr:ABC transporter ATP-binding protein [Candidatus Calditenuaceae archaeon]MDW8073380.1 ABC transporter ATP-binding protein [Nitrososphaerota archaeon]
MKRSFFSREDSLIRALDGVSLGVERGVVFSLVGPNGAGKTTMVKILSTLLIPDGGRAEVGGYDVVKQANHVRRIIGLVLAPDKGFYTRLTGIENLVYYGRLYGLSKEEAVKKAEQLLELTGLGADGARLYEEYSLGMRAKLSIAKALINDPEIVFLDEPTIGLDPLSARRIRSLIKDLATQGMTVFMTSHNMWEVEALSNTVAVIKSGKIVAEGSPAELKERLRLSYRLEVEIIADKSPDINFPVTVGERGYPVVTMETDRPGEDLVKVIDEVRRLGYSVGGVRVLEPSLEEVLTRVLSR